LRPVRPSERAVTVSSLPLATSALYLPETAEVRCECIRCDVRWLARLVPPAAGCAVPERGRACEASDGERCGAGRCRAHAPGAPTRRARRLPPGRSARRDIAQRSRAAT